MKRTITVLKAASVMLIPLLFGACQKNAELPENSSAEAKSVPEASYASVSRGTASSSSSSSFTTWPNQVPNEEPAISYSLYGKTGEIVGVFEIVTSEKEGLAKINISLNTNITKDEVFDAYIMDESGKVFANLEHIDKGYSETFPVYQRSADNNMLYAEELKRTPGLYIQIQNNNIGVYATGKIY